MIDRYDLEDEVYLTPLTVNAGYGIHFQFFMLNNRPNLADGKRQIGIAKNVMTSQ